MIRWPASALVLLVFFSGLAALPASAQSSYFKCGRLPHVSFDDLSNPLHWHFGRLANLSFQPIGKLRPRDSNSEAAQQFDNFGDDYFSDPIVYVDDGGIEYLLQPPPKSIYHQPNGDRWFGIGIKGPLEPADYPNRKFVSRPDLRGRSFEIVLGPDDPSATGGYSYERQRIVRGSIGGSFNWVDSSHSLWGHFSEDMVPHDNVWLSDEPPLARDGDSYDPALPTNDIRPQPGETPGQFLDRWESIADAAYRLYVASVHPGGDVQVAHGSDGSRYRVVGSLPVAVFDVPRELNHAFERYLDYVGLECEPPSEAPVSGSVWGDPHFSTFDGASFDFQGHGEFLLLGSADGEGPTIQIRQVPHWRTPDVSVVSGVAMRINGTRITVQRHRPVALHINGVPTTLAGRGAPLVTPSGIRIETSEVSREQTPAVQGGRFEISWGDGPETIAVDVFERSMSVKVTVVPDGNQTGLLGNGDGGRDNDLTTRDGSTTVEPDSSSEIHEVFGESWRITEQTSRFDYEPGSNTDSFTDRSFPTEYVDADDLDPNMREEAAAACRAAGVTLEPFHTSCVLDYGLTQSPEFIAAGGLFADAEDARAECAVRFDGDDDELVVRHDFDSSELTFEAWVLPESVNQNEFVTGAGLATYGAGDRSAWSVWLMAPNQGPTAEVGLHAELNVDLTTSPWTIGETGAPTEPIEFRRWVHVAVSYDGESQRKLFVDGNLVHTAPWDSAIGTGITNRALVLGNEFLGLGDFFGGEMDEVRLWSLERTEAQIADSYNRKIDPGSEGLELYFQFDECEGQRVTDSTSNFHHGTLGSRTVLEASDPTYVASTAPVDPSEPGVEG